MSDEFEKRIGDASVAIGLAAVMACLFFVLYLFIFGWA